MPSTYQPVAAQPSNGGDLITRLSIENVNGANYVTKRDWRRLMDSEIRREGHEGFAPDESLEDPNTFPSEEEVTLIHCARKPNGKTAVIVGTETTLYRYFSFEDGDVYEDGVYEEGVYEDLSGEWLVIGEGFSENGHRWEARDVAGYTIFNNGVDLPVIYDLGQLHVRPLYELREQGIAFAGTIEEFNGMLVLGDIAELTEPALNEVFSGRYYSAVYEPDVYEPEVYEASASQTGTTVTASEEVFGADDIGKTIIFDGGHTTKIISFTAADEVEVDTSHPVPAQGFRVLFLYAPITDTNSYSRVQYRLITSDIGDPEDFGATLSVFTAFAGTNTVSLRYPTLTLKVGDAITIQGAGVAGAALSTTITFISGDKKTLTVADEIVTFVTNVDLQKTDRLESTSSAFDLQDDGSAIIRIAELQGRLVVLKETSIFVGTFTGGDPLFTFQRVYSGPNSIGWKWMLAKINGERLLYAGASSFLVFDLASLTPKTHEKLFMCQNVFYDSATDLSIADECWAADNAITKEIWFAFPGDEEDHAICYDYQFNTCSTLAENYTAACTVEKPQAGSQIGVGEDWFVMGKTTGEVLKYGLTNLAPGIWTRSDETYTSTIKSGYFTQPENFNEQDLRNYVVYFSVKAPATPVIVTLYGARNAHEPAATLFTRTIASPTYKNLIPTYFRKNYYQDQIVVDGEDTNVALVRRVLEFSNIDTRSTIRNNST